MSVNSEITIAEPDTTRSFAEDNNNNNIAVCLYQDQGRVVFSGAIGLWAISRNSPRVGLLL